MINTVLFDFDGTLFDTESVNKTCYSEVAYNWNLKNFDKVFEECLGVNEERERATYQEYYGKYFDYLSFINEVEMLKESHILTYGLDLKVGAREIVESLFDECKLGVVSSSPLDWLITQLTKAGLIDYFEFVVSGENFTEGKPSPKIYRETCEKYAITPENCVAIEDSINGVKSAYNAGLRTIMVKDLVEPDEYVKSIPVKVCDNLFQAQVLIENWRNEDDEN